MFFHETGLQDAWLIEAEPAYDERGFFTRTFCVSQFAMRGLETSFVQHSMSHSKYKHTLRGMHFQRPPYEEVKLVSCVAGAIFDVILDLRPDSPTYLQWAGFHLTPESLLQLYIPKGVAHGFQTLADDSIVNYLISEFYTPGAASGLRFDDPVLGIEWPAEPTAMSDKDRKWPLLAPAYAS
jgi:dTDP-4-dehydrorhamnose 3,5-epimerase